MNESFRLLQLFEGFTPEQRCAVRTQFNALAVAYPHKCYHYDGYTDLWLCAIADVHDGLPGPWL
jgi:hypothetical protein